MIDHGKNRRIESAFKSMVRNNNCKEMFRGVVDLLSGGTSADNRSNFCLKALRI